MATTSKRKLFKIASFSLLMVLINFSQALTALSSVKNLRPVALGNNLLYRCATLDKLSTQEAQLLLSGEALLSNDDNNSDSAYAPLAAVIDLRNIDEIEKGQAERTKGSELFYSDSNCNFVHIPLLEDIDAFWDEAINRMDPKDKVLATLNTVFQGGALDRAAAKNFQNGGHAMLNTIIMSTGKSKIKEALQTILEESKRGPIIFHCQKGKDRTGVLGMLIQSILNCSEEEIIDAYSQSEIRLGNDERKGSDDSNGLIDWSYFRGSPASGMRDTLQWTKQEYGSISVYLDRACLFDFTQQSQLKDVLSAEQPRN